MTTKYDSQRCPLCNCEELILFFKDTIRVYLRCTECWLVFVPECHWLSAEEERSIYDLHQNDALDQGYRRFLARLSAPLLERLDPNQHGLDFGCGPGPTLSVLFEEQGHKMDLYDPLYDNDLSVFERTYDFICASEVVEHVREPGNDFDTLFKMLTPGGWLGIMTKLVIDLQAFSRWHYIRDMTHICFYSRSTFAYIAKHYDAQLSIVANDVILLKNKS